MAIDWGVWGPLILGGAGVGAQIYGAKSQAGAMDKATEANAEAAKRAISLLAGQWALNYGNQAPYRALGTSAMQNLSRFPAFKGIDFSAFPKTPDQGAPTSPALADVFRSAGIPVPGGGGAPGGLAAALEGQPQFGDISTKGIQSRGSRILGSALGGAGIGMGAKALGGALMSPALSAATLGMAPVAGAAIGAIRGAFDNNNPDKNFASEGINRVSDWTWNTLMPAVKSGQISPQDAENAFNDVWGKWETSMIQTPGFNKDVAAKSIASQRQYFQPFYDEINRLKQPTTGTSGTTSTSGGY